MQEFNQPTSDIFQNPIFQQSLQKAQKRFLFQPFAIRFRLLKRLCSFRFLCHSISIATAIFFLGTLISTAISQTWLAFLIALFFLVLWEIVKGVLLQYAYEFYYQFKRLSYISIAIILVLLAGSIYSSINGAAKFYQKENVLLTQINKNYQTQKKEIISYYDDQIKQLKEELDEYTESVSWKGKIDVRSKTNQKVIDNYTEQKKVLLEEKRVELYELKEAYLSSKTITIQNQQFNRSVFGLLSGINEVMIMVLSWFLVFYDYKTVQEAKDFQVKPDENIDFQNQAVQSDMFEPVQTSFEPEGTGTFFNSGLTQDQAYLLKYQSVVDSINAGLSEKEILDKTGVSRTTFYNVKRCLRNA